MNLKLKIIIIAALVVVLGGLTALVLAGRSDDPVESEEQPAAYVDWNETAFAENDDKQRWLYFHADWCPQCRALEADILANPDGIPDEVVIFKVDFDNSEDLRGRYGVNKQTTIVSVDEEGEELEQLLVSTSQLSQAVEALYIQPQAEEEDAGGEEGDGQDNGSDTSGSDGSETSDDNDGGGSEATAAESGSASSAGLFIDWSEAAFAEHDDKQRWLYFHADWCSQCRALKADILANKDDIPSEVVIFQVEFDDNQSLRQRYGVTLQTTIVSVDENGDKLSTTRTYTTPKLAEVIRGLGYE